MAGCAWLHLSRGGAPECIAATPTATVTPAPLPGRIADDQLRSAFSGVGYVDVSACAWLHLRRANTPECVAATPTASITPTPLPGGIADDQLKAAYAGVGYVNTLGCAWLHLARNSTPNCVAATPAP